jgi:hypothetical protein
MQASYTRSWAGSEAPPPGSVRPRFYTEPVQDELASAREGRPIFNEFEFVEIFMPGNPWHMPVHRVNDDHRARWPREYELFRQGLEQTADGTPIEEWPILNRSQVMELRALQIRTIEEVSSLSDTACQRAMGLTQLRNKARAYLDDAAAMALTEQLGKENESLRADMASLKRQNEELSELVNRLHGEVMGLKNAPNPIASAIPGMMDPMQAAQMGQAAITSREDPRSSLGSFVDEKRKPGRPRREVA